MIKPTYIGDSIEYFEDSMGKLSLYELLLEAEPEWRTNTTLIPNFGYTQSTFWVRFGVVNETKHTVIRVVDVAYPVLDILEFFLIKDGAVVKTYLVGDKFPLRHRPIAHRNFLFDFDLAQGESAQIYIRVKSTSSIQLPISISTEREFFLADERFLFKDAVYYGVMLVMLLVNFFLWVSLKEVVYLYYIFFVFSFAGVIFSLHGLPNQYIWPNHPYLQDVSILVLVPSIVLFASLFARKFLNLAVSEPRVNRLFYGYAWLALGSILGAFVFDYQTSIAISLGLVVPVSISMLLIGPYLWREGHTIARFYTMAWMSITVAAVAIAFNKFGIIPRTFMTENGLQIGSGLEAILLTMALADRLNRERVDRLSAEEKVVFNALHHPITNLPNAAYLENWLEQRDLSVEESHYLALVHMTELHAINKTIGHLLAVELLDELTSRINRYAKDSGFFYRIDLVDKEAFYTASIDNVTFALVYHSNAKVDGPQQIVTQLIDHNLKLIEFKGMILDVCAVAGVSRIENRQTQGWRYIHNAQIAVDMCDSNSKHVQLFSEVINPYSARKMAIAGELRFAILHDNLELYFQPKIDVSTGIVSGVEVLLRWTHNQFGFIPPDEFIPIAEQTGLINELTDWVLDRAVKHVSHLRRQGYPLTVAVNISAINLKQKEFAETVFAKLKKHDMEPRYLFLELTESSMMDDPATALSVLDKINDLGVQLSIDDFGTGYSSLSYINRLPVRELKIDRSFVLQMMENKQKHIIVITTINMCHDLGYAVVAEGVETRAVFSELANMGCDYLQGYYFCKPLPYKAFSDWLQLKQRFSLDKEMSADGQLLLPDS